MVVDVLVLIENNYQHKSWKILQVATGNDIGENEGQSVLLDVVSFSFCF